MASAIIRLALIFLAVPTFSVPSSWACSCARSAPGTCPDLKDSEISFVGTVIGIENPPDERRGADQSGNSRYRFRVDESLNGRHPRGRWTGYAGNHCHVRWTENPVPDDVFLAIGASDGNEPVEKTLSPGVFQINVFRGVRYTIYATQDCGRRWEDDIGYPIGRRETEQVEVDGSDDRTANVALSLKETYCKPYPKRSQG